MTCWWFELCADSIERNVFESACFALRALTDISEREYRKEEREPSEDEYCTLHLDMRKRLLSSNREVERRVDTRQRSIREFCTTVRSPLGAATSAATASVTMGEIIFDGQSDVVREPSVKYASPLRTSYDGIANVPIVAVTTPAIRTHSPDSPPVNSMGWDNATFDPMLNGLYQQYCVTAPILRSYVGRRLEPREVACKTLLNTKIYMPCVAIASLDFYKNFDPKNYRHLQDIRDRESIPYETRAEYESNVKKVWMDQSNVGIVIPADVDEEGIDEHFTDYTFVCRHDNTFYALTDEIIEWLIVRPTLARLTSCFLEMSWEELRRVRVTKRAVYEPFVRRVLPLFPPRASFPICAKNSFPERVRSHLVANEKYIRDKTRRAINNRLVDFIEHTVHAEEHATQQQEHQSSIRETIDRIKRSIAENPPDSNCNHRKPRGKRAPREPRKPTKRATGIRASSADAHAIMSSRPAASTDATSSSKPSSTSSRATTSVRPPADKKTAPSKPNNAQPHRSSGAPAKTSTPPTAPPSGKANAAPATKPAPPSKSSPASLPAPPSSKSKKPEAKEEEVIYDDEDDELDDGFKYADEDMVEEYTIGSSKAPSKKSESNASPIPPSGDKSNGHATQDAVEPEKTDDANDVVGLDDEDAMYPPEDISASNAPKPTVEAQHKHASPARAPQSIARGSTDRPRKSPAILRPAAPAAPRSKPDESPKQAVNPKGAPSVQAVRKSAESKLAPPNLIPPDENDDDDDENVEEDEEDDEEQQEAQQSDDAEERSEDDEDFVGENDAMEADEDNDSVQLTDTEISRTYIRGCKTDEAWLSRNQTRKRQRDECGTESDASALSEYDDDDDDGDDDYDDDDDDDEGDSGLDNEDDESIQPAKRQRIDDVGNSSKFTPSKSGRAKPKAKESKKKKKKKPTSKDVARALLEKTKARKKPDARKKANDAKASSNKASGADKAVGTPTTKTPSKRNGFLELEEELQKAWSEVVNFKFQPGKAGPCIVDVLHASTRTAEETKMILGIDDDGYKSIREAAESACKSFAGRRMARHARERVTKRNMTKCNLPQGFPKAQLEKLGQPIRGELDHATLAVGMALTISLFDFKPDLAAISLEEKTRCIRAVLEKFPDQFQANPEFCKYKENAASESSSVTLY